jgi:predicted nucleic acid-binding protein
MTGRVFVDTNVWLYAVDRDEPVKQAAARAVLAGLTDGRLVTSPQVIGEFYVNATRKFEPPISPERADQMVSRMARVDVVPLDAKHARAAIDGSRRWHLSYWDALIVVAAQSGGCDRLLSEDFADGATYGRVRVENPFTVRPHLSETPAPYDTRPMRWSDADLRAELSRYEQACRDAGMRPNAIHAYWDFARRFLAWRTGDYRPRGTAASGRPVPPDGVDIDTLGTQIGDYSGVLRRAGLEPVTIETYERHASFFVRWLRGDFRPGSRL